MKKVYINTIDYDDMASKESYRYSAGHEQLKQESYIRFIKYKE